MGDSPQCGDSQSTHAQTHVQNHSPAVVQEPGGAQIEPGGAQNQDPAELKQTPAELRPYAGYTPAIRNQTCAKFIEIPNVFHDFLIFLARAPPGFARAPPGLKSELRRDRFELRRVRFELRRALGRRHSMVSGNRVQQTIIIEISFLDL